MYYSMDILRGLILPVRLSRGFPSTGLSGSPCFLSFCSTCANADTLTITSTPSGAKVEINGVAEGTTPFEKEFPGGYFHKTRTSLGATIASDPPDAEIYWDEKFVGNAPAKLKLPTGSHTIVLKAPGYLHWSRTLETLKDSQVMLRPVLDRQQ